ncbi:MAG: M12 family metallo-peptidase [Phycisphaerae bacterium]
MKSIVLSCGVCGLIALSLGAAWSPHTAQALAQRVENVDSLATVRYESVAAANHLALPRVALGDSQTVTLELTRFDVFAADAQLVAETAQGTVALSRPPVAMFRGGIVGESDSLAFLSVSPFGTYGFVRTTNTDYVISSGSHAAPQTPRATAIADLDAFVQSAANSLCGNGFDVPTAPGYVAPDPSTVTPRGPGLCYAIDLAIDTDTEFTASLFGGNTQAALAYIATLMGAITEVYDRDVDARFSIVYTRLWTGDDPWNQGNTLDQLFEFRDHWNLEMTGIQRHAVHYLSGRGLGGGVAYVGALCAPGFDYGLSANLAGFFPYPIVNNSHQNWDFMVVAHELGHNFGAPHTHSMSPAVDCCGGAFGGNCGGVQDCNDADSGTIMSYCHLCEGGMSNIRLEFHPRTIAETIAPFLDSTAQFCSLTGEPEIFSQTQSFNTCGGRTELSVAASRVAVGGFEWRRGGVPLANGGRISGVDQPTLVIDPATAADAGVYDVVLTGACEGSLTSNPITLTVTSLTGDIDTSGAVNLSDLARLLSRFGVQAGATLGDGDIDGDGDVDLSDLAALLANFGVNCPG